jgi:hypothetical protein
MTTQTFWHIAHPAWTPGQPLRPRNDLIADGVEIEWLWDEADDGTDCDRVCLFPDTEQGRQHRDWLLDDRPGYTLVRIDLPEDFEIGRAEWEPYPAVIGDIPAEHITVASA